MAWFQGAIQAREGKGAHVQILVHSGLAAMAHTTEFCLARVRHHTGSVLEAIPGGLSRLCRMIRRIFFAEVGHSFARGILIDSEHGDFVVEGIFAGVLADLAGHREVTPANGSWRRCM